MKTRNYIDDDKDGDLPDAGDFCTVLNEMDPLPSGEYLITRHGVVLINLETLAEILTDEDGIKCIMDGITSEKIDRFTNKDCQW